MKSSIRTYPLGVDSGVTRILEVGSGDRNVLLIHGVGARADRWERNLVPLARAGLHVFACDLPGHGFASKDPGFAYSVSGYVEFVEQMADALGLDHHSFIGSSLGANVAAAFAIRHPKRVDRLVLVGAVGLQPLGDLGERLAHSILDTSREGIRAKLKIMVGDPDLITDDWVNEEYRVNTSPGAPEALRRLSTYFADGIDRDLVLEGLSGLDHEILLVWGAEDTAVPPSMGRASVGALRNASFIEIPKAGHVPYFVRADEFNDRVVDFLS